MIAREDDPPIYREVVAELAAREADPLLRPSPRRRSPGLDAPDPLGERVEPD